MPMAQPPTTAPDPGPCRAAVPRRATQHHRLALAKLVHDLRTPIHGVLGMLHLLPARRNDQQAWDEALDIIRSCAHHQLLIVDDIVDLARLGEGALTLHPRRFDLRASLAQTLAIVQATARLKGLELTLSVRADVPECVVADERRLRQVLLNLLANALKHTSVGSVRLLVNPICDLRSNGARAARLEFSVVDTGRGIDETGLSHLFQVFQQVSDEHDDIAAGSGAGLGLVLCSEMLALMDSRLRCASAAGQGCTFSFELDLPVAAAYPVNRVAV